MVLSLRLGLLIGLRFLIFFLDLLERMMIIWNIIFIVTEYTFGFFKSSFHYIYLLMEWNG